MSTPHDKLEGQSITRPPYFNGQHCGWWNKKTYIQAEDYQLWMLIKDGTKIHKKPEEFTIEDYKMMEKNVKAKKLLYFGLGPNEYTRISECESAKHIWEAPSSSP